MGETEQAKWYILHTYSGYENIVKANLEQMIENNNLQDQILDIKIPTEQTIEEKNGKKKAVETKIMPCYVFVKLVYSSQLWYMLTYTTRGVTGFVGPDSKPVALTPEEVEMMLSTQENSVEFGIAIGEEVRILSGPLENFTGTVEDVDTVRQKLTVKVKMFLGREMPVEVDLQDVEKLQGH